MDDYSHTDGGEPDRNGTYRDDGREATSNTPVDDVLQTSAENRDRNTQQPHSYPRPPLEVDVIRQSHNQSTGAGLPQHQQQIPMMNMNTAQSQVQYNDANALLLQQLLQQVQTANAPPPIQLYQGITTGRVPAGAAAASTQTQLQATTNAIYIAPFTSPSTSQIPISVPLPPTAAASNVTIPSATSDATSSFIVANLAATNPQDIMTAIQQLVAQIQSQPTAAAGTRPAQILPPPVAPIHISTAAPALPPQQQFVPSDSAGVAAGDPISLILSNLAVPRNNAAGASTTLTALGTTSGIAQPAHQQYNNILYGLIQMLVQQQQQQPTPATTGSAAGGIHLTPQQLLEAMTQPTTASGATMPTSSGIPSMIWHPQQQMNATALQGASGSSQSMTTVYGQAPEYSLARQPQIQQHHHAQQRPVTSSLVTSTMSSFTTSDAAGAGSSSSLPQPTSSSSSSTSSLMTGRSPVSLYLDFDSTSLNEFQCLLRQQIEVFETPTHQARSSQGRNTPIVAGQVGIRCKWCFDGAQRSRPVKGCIYYSKRLDGIYQVAQNLAKTHFLTNADSGCPNIPRDIKNQLIAVHSSTKRGGAGKSYWTDGLRALGVYEHNNTLRFRPLTTTVRGTRQQPSDQTTDDAVDGDDTDFRDSNDDDG